MSPDLGVGPHTLAPCAREATFAFPHRRPKVPRARLRHPSPCNHTWPDLHAATTHGPLLAAVPPPTPAARARSSVVGVKGQAHPRHAPHLLLLCCHQLVLQRRATCRCQRQHHLHSTGSMPSALPAARPPVRPAPTKQRGCTTVAPPARPGVAALPPDPRIAKGQHVDTAAASLQPRKQPGLPPAALAHARARALARPLAACPPPQPTSRSRGMSHSPCGRPASSKAAASLQCNASSCCSSVMAAGRRARLAQ